MPGELDILIIFNPWKSYSGEISPSGGLRFKAIYSLDWDKSKLSNNTKIVERP